MLAITRKPGNSITNCELTFLDREPIDPARMRSQHAAYCETLSQLGAKVVTLDADESFPDSVFVEDTAVVLDEIAIICRPGAESRRGEVDIIADVLSEFREVRRIEAPGTLDGGDVLQAGRRILVGHSSRSSEHGIRQLAQFAEPFGYTVEAIPVSGCLHLKTACGLLPDGSLLINPNWIDARSLAGFHCAEIPSEEQFSANTLPMGTSVILPARHRQCAARIAERGIEPARIEIGEFAKAEAGVTCLSLLLAD